MNEIDELNLALDQDVMDFLNEISRAKVAGLTVYPGKEVILEPGDTLQFNSIVNGENFPNQGVMYSIAAASGSLIEMDSATVVDPTGLLKVGRNELNNELTLTITPTADITKVVTVKVSVIIPFESFVYDLSKPVSDPVFGDADTAVDKYTVNLLIGSDPDNNFIVNWGDGSTPEPNTITHTYTTQGTYTITVSGRTPGGITFNTYYINGNHCHGEQRLTVFITPLLQQSSANGGFMFGYCSNLTSILSDLFANNTSVTSFYATFFNCISLSKIPSDLFANNTKVTNFYCTFYGCSVLTEISAELFSNNKAVTSFYHTFAWCTGIAAKGLPEWWTYSKIEFPQFNLVGDAMLMFTGCANAINWRTVPPDWR
jgi:hypothetical protein